MDYSAINFDSKLEKITEHFSPRTVARLNDYYFKLVKFKGDFVWHRHEHTDEAFIVLDGEMRIDFRDGKVDLRAGEMYIVPKGKEHKPLAEEECRILLVEPGGTVNTGDAGGDLTSEEDVWI